MAEINYSNILEQLAQILLTDSRTHMIGNSELQVSIEGDFEATSDTCPYVGLSLESWSMPQEDELVGGSNPFRTILGIKLSLSAFSLETKNSAGLRDFLFRKVKEVLKDNRTINGTVLISWFGSGDFTSSGDEDSGFFRGIDFEFMCEIRE